MGWLSAAVTGADLGAGVTTAVETVISAAEAELSAAQQVVVPVLASGRTPSVVSTGSEL